MTYSIDLLDDSPVSVTSEVVRSRTKSSQAGTLAAALLSGAFAWLALVGDTTSEAVEPSPTADEEAPPSLPPRRNGHTSSAWTGSSAFATGIGFDLLLSTTLAEALTSSLATDGFAFDRAVASTIGRVSS